MKARFLHIALFIGIMAILLLSSCSKKCKVNGCRVRMVHRHSGKKFKSKVRKWYTYQNPRVGRDYKRDVSPDKIPWDRPDVEGAEGKNMLASNDTSSFGDDGFMGDEFYEGDSLGRDGFLPGEEESGKKKKRRRRAEEEDEVEEKQTGDPWDIENIKEEDPVVRKPVTEDKKDEIAEIEAESSEEKKEDSEGEKEEEKKSKKEIAEERKKAREELLKKQLEEEEEEDDDWGF